MVVAGVLCAILGPLLFLAGLKSLNLIETLIGAVMCLSAYGQVKMLASVGRSFRDSVR
jgi:hypothetical protein